MIKQTILMTREYAVYQLLRLALCIAPKKQERILAKFILVALIEYANVLKEDDHAK